MKFSLLFCSLFMLGCHQPETPFDMFFKDLQSHVSKKIVIIFKTTQKDSATYYFKKIEPEFWEVYGWDAHKNKLDQFFNEQHIYHEEARAYYLCFAWHAKLNNEPYNHDTIVKHCDETFSRIKDSFEVKERRFERETHDVMIKNAMKWDVGEMIEIILPAKTEQGGGAAYYCISRPSLLDCTSFNDSLKIKGNLIEKKYYTYEEYGNLDTSEITFKVKVLSIDKPNYKIFDKKRKVGDIIDLHLSAYGKPIYSAQ